MDELLAWLKPQHNGLRTYKAFQQKVMQLGATDRNHLALYHILAMLAARFIESLRRAPPSGRRRRPGVQPPDRRGREGREVAQGSPAEQLTALNEIAATDLG